MRLGEQQKLAFQTVQGRVSAIGIVDFVFVLTERKRNFQAVRHGFSLWNSGQSPKALSHSNSLRFSPSALSPLRCRAEFPLFTELPH